VAVSRAVPVLAWRDLAVRYKQTVIGAAWAVIHPFLTKLVFTVIFGRTAKLPSDGQPLTATVAVVWTASGENKLQALDEDVVVQRPRPSMLIAISRSRSTLVNSSLVNCAP
jgi:hypothetical protein